MNYIRTSLTAVLGLFLISSQAFGQAPPPAPKPAPQTPPVTAKPAENKPAATQATPAPKQVKPTDIVLWIGDESITAERFEAITRSLPPQYIADKKNFANQYGMLRGFAIEGEKGKLDQTQAFQDLLGFMRMQMLAQQAFQEISKAAQVSEDDVKKQYTEHQADYQQVKLRGIFVSLAPPAKPQPSPTQADGKADPNKPEAKKQEPATRSDAEAKELALKLRQKILAGADFSAVAKESSDEPGTAAKGGDFGTVQKGQLGANMEKAIFALKPKDVSEPVQEARGYYLFMVDEIKTTPYEQASAMIRQQLQKTKLDSVMEKVKVQHPVKLNEDYFAQQATPGTPPQPRIMNVK